ncbi:unnamed protein product [Alopecurus aequalis]
MGNINSCWGEKGAKCVATMSRSAYVAHSFPVTNYSLLKRPKGEGVGEFISSETFTAGGYKWSIRFYPNGADWETAGYAAADLCLRGGEAATRRRGRVETQFTLSLLGTDGKVHRDCKASREGVTHTFRSSKDTVGFRKFIRKSKLREDCFTIRQT